MPNVKHPQSVLCSSETRSKISNSLSLVWDARKKTKQAQETLIEQWRECIADTARRGDGSNEAYEWNSYNLILKELQHIWNLNRKKRKKKESSVGLSVDHRIKISNAIKSKWANIVSPTYVNKICLLIVGTSKTI